jgi:hypothetical protein
VMCREDRLSLACLLTRRVEDRSRRWTSALGRSTMGRHGLLGSSSRLPTYLPRLALLLLRAPSRCSLRPYRRHPIRRLRTLHRPPEPRGRPPPWLGSLYAALSKGQIDQGRLRSLLSRHSLEDESLGDPPIYAVDVSVWSRCDAEASPGRGYYYRPWTPGE